MPGLEPTAAFFGYIRSNILTMRDDIKAQWVAALRSGHYPQGYGVLKDSNNTYCCLGVLCELYAEAHKATTFWHERDVVTEYLPTEVQAWAELPSPIVQVAYGGRDRRLAGLNDDNMMSFDQLADLIETNLVTLASNLD